MNNNKVHLVIGDSAYGCVAAAINNTTDSIVKISDYLVFGPLANLDSEQGNYLRRLSVKRLFSSVPYFQEYWSEVESEIGIKQLISLKKEKVSQVIVWCANNTNEQLLLLAASYWLEQKQIKVINVTTLLEDTDKIKAVAQCSPETLAILQDKAYELTYDEYNNNRLAWKRLVQENKLLRVLFEGEIHSVARNFYDAEILTTVTTDFQNAAKIVGEVMGSSDISDLYLDSRVRKLIKQGKLIADRDINNQPLFEFKIKQVD